MTKVCKVCSQDKPLTEYPKKGKWLMGRCRDCHRNKQKAYYEANRQAILEQKAEYWSENRQQRKAYVDSRRDYYREKSRQWYKEHPEHNRIKSQRRRANEFSVTISDFPVNILDFLVTFFGSKCLNPDCKTVDPKPSLDHVVPLSMGGAHSVENFQVLCVPCNSSKGNRSSADYRGGLVYRVR